LHPVYSIISVAVSVWSCLWSGHIPGLILSPASCALSCAVLCIALTDLTRSVFDNIYVTKRDYYD
jgi:hypothetical protein